MQKVLIALLLLTFSFAFQLEVEQMKDSPILKARLPSFIGAGYHALKGNPYTNRVDEGFRSPAFSLTYDQGRTTDDGQFMIPDFTTSTQTVSCTLNSKVKDFSGTQSYQKQMSILVDFDARFSGLVMDSKFSFSAEFKSFSNKTLSQKLTSVQSNAECFVYTLEMPIYTNQMKLSTDFIEGVKQSYQNNNWDDFLQHFGSHYTTKVAFGGRYFLQHTYSEQNIALFKSMSIDLKLAAQVQFFLAAKMSLSQQYKRYINQTKVVNTKVQTNTISTVGGLPPASGVWTDWVNTVKSNLAPISYKMTAITVLFNYVPGINAAAAIASFSTFFNNYCGRNVCPPLTPDRPDPKPLLPVFSKLPQMQGKSKSPRRYDTNDGQIAAGMKIVKVLMGMDANFDSVQFILSNGIVQHPLPNIPVSGAIAHNRQYNVPDGDQIKCIRFGVHPANNATSFLRFSTVQFVTKAGVQSQVYKARFAATQILIQCVQSMEDHIVGFYGAFNSTSGINTFDSIGLNIMKEVLQGSIEEEQ